ncbi:MAG: hypothetical protein CR967_02445 [Proteobacteria bacterium]|nr:MAG: hypothetical protein CR967_02445 [Pseudomonadota bacterium]
MEQDFIRIRKLSFPIIDIKNAPLFWGILLKYPSYYLKITTFWYEKLAYITTFWYEKLAKI